MFPLIPIAMFGAFVAGVAFERNKHATPEGQAPAKSTAIVAADSTTTVPVGTIVVFDASSIPLVMGRYLNPATSDTPALDPIPAVTNAFKAVSRGMARLTIKSSDGVSFNAYLNIV